jgi:hypothetical protein
MDTIASKAGWDVYLFGIPLIALLVFGFFRLDQVFTSRKAPPPEGPRPSTDIKRHEKSMLSDPDGRPWDDQ